MVTKQSLILSLLFCIVFLTHTSADDYEETLRALEEFGRRSKYIDITHKIQAGLPVFDSQEGLGDDYIWLVLSIKKGNASNNSEFKLSTHQATHIDAPSHFYQAYYDSGLDITTVDLSRLHGPVLVVDVPRDKNITAEVLKSLKLPRNVHRVLFRTSNTDKRLMYQKEFDSSFTGFTADGAKWLVDNTNIKVVGLDYLSVAAYTEGVPVHLTFLKNGRVTPIEGLKLDNVKPGIYVLQCLPLLLSRADGCPSRCLLWEKPTPRALQASI